MTPDFLIRSLIFLRLEQTDVTDSLPSGFKDGGGILGAVLMLVVMLAVIVGAYFVTRFIASGMMGGGMRGSRMQVVDRLILARDKAILVVRIGDSFFAVGVAGNSVSLISELPPGLYDENETAVSETQRASSWKDVLNRNMHATPKRKKPSAVKPQRRGRSVSEEELSEMAERMRLRSQTLSNREEGHD